MPNTKAVGVAYSDPEFESVTVTGAVTSASVAVTGAITGASVVVTGKLSGTQLDLNAPVTKTASFTLGETENFVIANGSAANVTVTLPSGTDQIGRVLFVKNLSASFTLISASSNVKPRTSNTAGTAILAATAGAFATLVCEDGTNWVVMAGN